MKIRVIDELPLVSVTLIQNNRQVTLPNVLLDTGSAGCVFSTDKLREAGIGPMPGAMIRRITGIGGAEFVIETFVDSLQADQLQATQFTIEIGAVSYGYDFDGILGFDFLQQAQAIIDLSTMELRPSR